MPTTRSQACRIRDAQTYERKQQQYMLQNIAALPQSLLEKILICCTSTEDKKALRQTCKYFQKILDDNLLCIKLWRMERLTRLQFEQNFMKGMRHWQNLKAVHFNTTLKISMLLKHLPSTLTTLRCSTNDVKELARLPCLTTLHLDGHWGEVTGMQHISGLTRLHCNRSVGSISHLAPTLKHLCVGDCSEVQGMDQLTNLEDLNILQSIPADFFRTHKQLPLKHLTLRPRLSGHSLQISVNWAAAPSTLKHLTLIEDGLSASMGDDIVPNPHRDYIALATTALPWLARLDLCFYDVSGSGWDATWPVLDHALQSLSKLAHLQLLNICADRYPCMPREEVIPALPAVAAAEARGLKVNVVETQEECNALFWAHHDYIRTNTAWAAPA